MRSSALSVFVLVLFASLWAVVAFALAPPRTCCQLPADGDNSPSCYALPGKSPVQSVRCQVQGGTPSTGECNPTDGLCGGTPVCCNTFLECLPGGAPSNCFDGTAADCDASGFVNGQTTSTLNATCNGFTCVPLEPGH
jgi:hypothetical protein